ncbi:unnamed protein product, partial [Polarella glacialis]
MAACLLPVPAVPLTAARRRLRLIYDGAPGTTTTNNNNNNTSNNSNNNNYDGAPGTSSAQLPASENTAEQSFGTLSVNLVGAVLVGPDAEMPFPTHQWTAAASASSRAAVATAAASASSRAAVASGASEAVGGSRRSGTARWRPTLPQT